jgi:hypothetical protein
MTVAIPNMGIDTKSIERAKRIYEEGKAKEKGR